MACFPCRATHKLTWNNQGLFLRNHQHRCIVLGSGLSMVPIVIQFSCGQIFIESTLHSLCLPQYESVWSLCKMKKSSNVVVGIILLQTFACLFILIDSIILLIIFQPGYRLLSPGYTNIFLNLQGDQKVKRIIIFVLNSQK